MQRARLHCLRHVGRGAGAGDLALSRLAVEVAMITPERTLFSTYVVSSLVTDHDDRRKRIDFNQLP